jgi:hypothetical protein
VGLGLGVQQGVNGKMAIEIGKMMMNQSFFFPHIFRHIDIFLRIVGY